MSRRRPPTIAVYGGHADTLARRLQGTGLRIYGGASQSGHGEVSRLIAALRHGRIAEVWVLWRWIGHSELGSVIATCKATGIPWSMVSSPSGIRRRLGRRS